MHRDVGKRAVIRICFVAGAADDEEEEDEEELSILSSSSSSTSSQSFLDRFIFVRFEDSELLKAFTFCDLDAGCCTGLMLWCVVLASSCWSIVVMLS